VEKLVRALREMTSFTSGGSEGGDMSVDSGDSDTEGSFFIFFRNLLGDGHKKLLFFTLVAQGNICHHSYNKGL
jgi:hypothetical protein